MENIPRSLNVEISVITGSHNPRPDYLRLVTEALASQTLDKRRWEYLLIDNASDKSLDSQVDLSWHPQSRHIREEKLGITHARLRGIQETTSDLLVFVDDDNALDSDYLEQVLNLARSWPTIGAFSGQVRPEFENPPPAWSRKYWHRLAIREFDHDRWSNIPLLDYTTPNGAGLCLRRRVALEYLRYHTKGKRKFILDRRGSDLLSAGDLDLATTACDIGLGNGLFTSLKLKHLIPSERLAEGYLLRLLEAQTFSAVILNSFRSNGESAGKRRPKTVVGDWLRFLALNSRERRFFNAEKKGQRKALQFLARNEPAGSDSSCRDIENWDTS
jgi:glycosyltransferase involved in cell wall biosynthesis